MVLSSTRARRDTNMPSVAELKKLLLKKRGLSDSGHKAELDARLAEAVLLLLAVGNPAPLTPGQLAAAREARNEECSAVVALPAPVQLVALSQLSVVQLWRVRRVSRHFRRLATEVLEGLPRLVSVGGVRLDRCGRSTPRLDGHQKLVRSPAVEVEVLNLSTMRWSAAGARGPPSLPAPPLQHTHSLAAFSDGRVVVAGGTLHPVQALQWVPGSAAWSTLPDMALERPYAMAVALPDGRLLVGGGNEDDSAEVLAADGSGWAPVALMTARRKYSAVIGLLQSGRVIVAGGCSERDGCALDTAEQWDPVQDTWTALPPLALKTPDGAAGCVLLNGRFAVVGGVDMIDEHCLEDGEVYDPIAGRWDPLPNMATGRKDHALVAVAGGMIAIGGAQMKGAADELYDEESGRWLALPHAMRVPRDGLARVVSVPAYALAFKN